MKIIGNKQSKRDEKTESLPLKRAVFSFVSLY